MFAQTAKRYIKAFVMAIPGAVAPFSLLLRRRATVLMLHRFQVPEMGVQGHDPDSLRAALDYLRRKRYSILSLQELFNRLIEGHPVHRAVAFTMDDGYWDQGSVAADLFREYDCPVTTFVTSGFLDGDLWMWWDQIEHIFDHTLRRELRLSFGGKEVSYTREEGDSWQKAKEDLIARCKEVPDDQRIAGIASLSFDADVEVPAQPPARYAPMSWDQARKCETRGMTFGPHSVTHPIMSKTTDDQSAREIALSWNRLCSQVQRPVPIFCYPNGRFQDFGAREIAVLRRSGLMGAVTGVTGYSETGAFPRGSDAPFKVQRFGYPDTMIDLIQIVGGVERFKQIVRGEA